MGAGQGGRFMCRAMGGEETMNDVSRRVRSWARLADVPTRGNGPG